MNKKTLLLICVITSAFLTMQIALVSAQTVDVGIVGLRGYPFTETLSEPETPLHDIYIGVAVKNFGTVSTTCTVTIYVNMNPVFAANLNLAPGEVKYTYYQTTTNDLGQGSHALSALVIAAGDTNPNNNYYVGNTIEIGMIGDVNLDGKVETKDLAKVSSLVGANGTVSPPWIPEVDKNKDGKIDAKDVAYYSMILDYNNLLLATKAYGSRGTHPFEWICDQYRDGVINELDVNIVANHFG